MSDLHEDLRAYFDRLAETAEQVTPARPAASVSTRDRRRVWSRAILALAAAFLLLAAIVVTVGLFDGHGGSDLRPLGTTPTTAMPTTTTEVPKRCGASLPLEPNVPDGFAGPTAGPAPGNPSPPVSSDQLVVHWTSTTTSIEYRWPADDNGVMASGGLDDLGTDGPIEVRGATMAGAPSSVGGPDAAGRFTREVYFYLHAPEGCHVMTSTVAGADPTAVDVLFDRLTDAPFVSHGQLLIGDEQVEEEPPVTPCRTPPGVSSPNQGGPTDPVSPRYGTPAEALQRFIDEHSGVLPFGWVAMHLPNGSITYGVRSPGIDGFVTVVHVQSEGDRWWVDRWEVSGC